MSSVDTTARRGLGLRCTQIHHERPRDWLFDAAATVGRTPPGAATHKVLMPETMNRADSSARS